MEASTITWATLRKACTCMIIELRQLRTWLNFILSQKWPSLQVLITSIGIKTENINLPYWSPWKQIFMHGIPVQGEPDCSLGIQSTVS